MNTLLKRSNDLEKIETIIDSITLPQVIDLMAEICHLKASHIRENWQDERAAKLWDKNAKILTNVSGKIYS